VVDGFEWVAAQQIGQLARIDAVALVPVFEQRVLPRIAHHQLVDAGVQQIVQPGGPGSFFEGHR
jgi:hypothetical protein